MKPSDFLTELSTEKLAQYKTAAAADASKADKEKDFARGDKRFSGIVKATKKQFANDAKQTKESVGLPYPSTYEQTNDMFKSSGQRRVAALTNEENIGEVTNHFHPNDILDEAAPWVNKLGLGNFFRKVQGVDADNQSNIRILSGVNHSMQLYFKTIMAMNASVGPTAALFWPLLGKQALMFVGGALVYTVGKILAGKAGRALFGSADEALAFAKAHLAAAKENNKTSFEFDGKTYPVTVKDPNAISKLEQQLGDLENIVFAKKTRAAQADYNKSIKAPKPNSQNMTAQPAMVEEWSQKYKNSINCSHPKGFSQKAHCAGKKKHNESIEMEMTCPDCGMCQTHGDHSKDKLDELSCWSGYHRVAGTKAGFPGSCAKNKTNEEQLNELDMFAPRTVYFKMADGNYIKADYRGSEGLSGHKGNDNVTFTAMSWVPPNTARTLGLDKFLAKGSDPDLGTTRQNAQSIVGTSSPGEGPLGNRTIDVVDFVNGKEDTVPSQLKTQVMQWVQKNQSKPQAPAQGVAEGKEDKIKQLKQDHDTAVHWSKNEKSPQKREAARQKAEKIKAHLEKQYKQGVVEGLPGSLSQSDYMPGPRGINLPSAPTKKFFTDKQKWMQAVDDINHSKYDDNSDYTGVTGRSTVSIDGREWARWSDAQQKGYIELSSMSEQGVAEGPRGQVKMRKWLVVHDGSHGEGGKDIIEAPNAETAWELANEYDLYIISIHPYKGSAEPTLVDEGVTEEKCPHCGGVMVSEELMNEKKDACYYKVKSRYKVWPSAYASGALVKCRKSHGSWGNGGKKNESSILEGITRADENLHQWFKEKWVRFGPDGKIRGACARGNDSEGKPKCLPQSKAQNLGKKGRASAAARKRREDPNPERSGKAINVATKKK